MEPHGNRGGSRLARRRLATQKQKQTGGTLFGSGSGGIMSSIGDTVKLIPYVIVGGGLISVLSLVKR